jgi:hypothetical protein
MSKSKKIFFATLLGFSILATVGIYTKKASAFTVTPTGDLHGYAWSSTIGWVSLNCLEGGTGGTSTCGLGHDYKVTRYAILSGTTGALAGYGWSSHLGWLSFAQGDTTGCATGATQSKFDLSTNQLSGWARFISVPVTDTGWNGCVNLKWGTGPTNGVQYNPSATPSIFGMAWGSSVVGWLGFFASYDGAGTTVHLQIAEGSGGVPSDGPITLPSSGASDVTLSYTTTGATSCHGTGLGASSSPSQTDWSSTTTTPSSGGSTHIVIAPNTGGSTVTHTYQITCTNGTTPVTSNIVTVNVLSINSPFLELKVNDSFGPISIDPGASGVVLKWTTQKVVDNTCTKTVTTGGYSGWVTPAIIPPTYTSSTTTPRTATYATGILSTAQTFSISCNPVGGGSPLTASVTVNMATPSCRVVGPSMSSVLVDGTTRLFDGTVNFGVVWDHTGGVFHNATLSTGTMPSGVYGSTVGSTATTDCAGSLSLNSSHPSAPNTECTGIHVTGATTTTTIGPPNLYLPITATVTPAYAGVTSCTPASLEIVPPGGTPTGGTGTSAAGAKRAPWQEQ